MVANLDKVTASGVEDLERVPGQHHELNVMHSDAMELEITKLKTYLRLTGRLGHDLNNYYLPIAMGIKILEDEIKDPALQSIIHTITDSSQKAAALVGNLMELSHGELMEKIPFPPGPLVKDLVKELKPTLPPGMKTQVSVPKGLWLIKCDPFQVCRLLTFLSDQIKFEHPEGGTIFLSVENITGQTDTVSFSSGFGGSPYVMFTVAWAASSLPTGRFEKLYGPSQLGVQVEEKHRGDLKPVLDMIQNHGGFMRALSQTSTAMVYKVFLPAYTE